MLKVIYSLIAVFLILASSTFQMISQELREKKIEFSISGGSLLPGTVEASYDIDFPDDRSVTIKNGLSPIIKIVADFNLKEYLSLGLNVNYAGFTIKDILYDGESMTTGTEVNLGFWDGKDHIIPFEGISMIEANASVKGRFFLNNNMILKPCIYIGYRKSFCDSQDAREDGVVLNYSFETQYCFKNTHFIFIDLGFLSQPYGGIDHVGYVRSIGVPNITAGYGISF